MIALGLIIVGVFAFLLLPALLAVPLSLLCFLTVCATVPYIGLVWVLISVIFHFLVRKHIFSFDVSIADVSLLAATLGVIGRGYWYGLVDAPELSVIFGRLRRSPYLIPALILVVEASFHLMRAVMSPAPGSSIVVALRAYTLLVEPISVYILALLSFRHRQNINWILDMLLLAGLLVALGAIYQAGRDILAGELFRTRSFFNHPNTLGLFLSRMIPFYAALCLLMNGQWLRRILYGSVVVLMGLALLLSGSRGGFLGVLAALILLAVILRRFRWLIPVGVGAVVILLIMTLAGESRFGALLDLGSGSADTRWRIWRAAFEQIIAHPLLGIGIGNVAWLVKYVPRERLVGAEIVDAHNFLLDFWSKLGAVGLGSLLALLLIFYLLAWDSYKHKKGSYRAIALAAICSMTAALVHGLVDAFYFGVPIAVFFWFLLGVVEVTATSPDIPLQRE